MLLLVLSHSPEHNHVATSNQKEGCRIYSSEDLRGLLSLKKKVDWILVDNYLALPYHLLGLIPSLERSSEPILSGAGSPHLLALMEPV